MWYDFLPIFIIITSLKAEKYFTARPSIVANVVSISMVLLPRWNTLWWPMQYYVGIGWILAMIAFISYMLRKNVDAPFYDISWLLYNSVIAALICIYFTIVG